MAKKVKKLIAVAETLVVRDYDGSKPISGNPWAEMWELFVSHVIQGMTDWDAFRKAGFKAKNASAGANALRKNPKVAARLAFRRGQLQEKLDITETRVLGEFAKLAFSNIQDYIGNDNHVCDISQLPREVAAAVQSVEVDIRHDNGDSDGYTEKVKIRMADKHKNLDSLAKHLGLFEKDNKQRQGKTIIEILAIVANDRNRGRNQDRGCIPGVS